MNASQVYIAILLVSLAIIAALTLYRKKTAVGKKLTPLASIAFAFVLGGIIYGENRLIGYGLLGIGVILALVDSAINKK